MSVEAQSGSQFILYIRYTDWGTNMGEMLEHLDWPMWLDRWDRMQERYLVRRPERFEIIARLIADTQPTVHNIVDLGCGTGTLTTVLMDRFPNAKVLGIDLDPTLLPLARARTSQSPERAHFVQTDLREESWLENTPTSVDAVVSATALHWPNRPQLESLYSQLTQILKPGGVFLNADHVGSESGLIQASWEKHRKTILQIDDKEPGEDWDSFWTAYLDMLGSGARQSRARATGEWEGIESGLPLVWHLDQLRDCGFSYVDCFWRDDCDAIYGGIRQ